MATTRTQSDTVVVMNASDGITLIPKPTTLTRLNYFDGKFLRAADLQAEQDYHRHLQQLAAQAGGPGVVHGFDLQTLAGDQIELGAGLAIDPAGRVLHLPQEAAVQIQDLIERSRGTTVLQVAGKAGAAVFRLCETATIAPLTPVVAGTSLYVIGIAHAEALCGQEDVFGRLCEQGCATGTERPQRLEGVVLRALPLQLATPLPQSRAVTMEPLHLRSRVASAWFADEARQIESLISGSGLLSSIWCHGAAPVAGNFVPLAVLARAGGHSLFLDGWTARRERVDGTPRRYWQWRMMMRPWDAFLAQVLQFQCQLRDAWRVPAGDDDPCQDLRRTVADVGDLLGQLERQYRDTSARLALDKADSARLALGKTDSKTDAAAEPVTLSRTLLASAVNRARAAKGGLVLQPGDRVLIRRGIVELPSAGYLPVAPGSAIAVNDQVRRLMGEGVDLRFCVVRPDFVAHALEEAQHMERISLLRGLDNPKQLEEVDILVPDGEILAGADNGSAAWEVALTRANATLAQKTGATAYQRDVMTGAARSEALADGSLAFHFAGLVETASRDAALSALKTWAGTRDNGLEQTLWKAVELNDEPARAAVLATAAASAAAPATLTRKSRAAVNAAPAAAAAPAPAPAELPTPQLLAARFAALREESVAYQTKTLERVASRGTTAGISHFEGLKDGKDSDHTALWLALRAESNALEATEGSRVDVSLELSLISPKAAGTVFIDVQIVGAQFIVESRATSGQRLAVQGTLRGAAIIHGLVGTLANAQRGLQFSVPALLTHEPTAEGSATRAEIDFSGMLFDNRGIAGIERLGLHLASAGPRAEARVQMVAQGVDLEMAARLQRNDAVLKLGHPLRAASETAIDVLATRESAPNFANRARADLFGERAAPRDALTVRATRDWVLFHRRRSKTCGAAPAAAVAEPRRYELQHLRVKTDAQLRAARAALIGANVAAIRKAGFAPVGAVAFDGGRSTLATATDALLADWQAAQPGSAIRFGAIGSQGAAQAEGNALAQARLAGLELALSLGALDKSVENQVLPVLPALPLTGWDGAIFLITQDLKLTCHDVLRLGDDKELSRFGKLIASGADVASAMKEFGVAPFAHAEFEADGKTLTAASLLALRAAWGLGKPQAASAVIHSGGSTGENAAVARAAAIVTALQGDKGSIQAQNTKTLAGATDCIGLSVLVDPPKVAVAQLLLGVAPFLQGSYVFSDNSMLSKHEFHDAQAVNPDDFAKAVSDLLGQRPANMATAVKSPAEQAASAPIKTMADELVAKLGYKDIRISNLAVLGEPEIQSLEALGFPRATWQWVLIFSGTPLR